MKDCMNFKGKFKVVFQGKLYVLVKSLIIYFNVLLWMRFM